MLIWHPVPPSHAGNTPPTMAKTTRARRSVMQKQSPRRLPVANAESSGGEESSVPFPAVGAFYIIGFGELRDILWK